MELKKGDIVVWTDRLENEEIVDFFVCMSNVHLPDNGAYYHTCGKLAGYSIRNGNKFELGEWSFSRKATAKEIEFIMRWLENHHKVFNFNTGEHDYAYR
jgi:hypothetical protein